MTKQKHIEFKQTGIEWIPSIPKHWELSRLKHIATINDESLSENTENHFLMKYIDIGNVNANGEITEIQEFNFGEAPSRARRIIKKGDVIISTVRTYLKAIKHIDFDVDNHIVSTGFAVLRPKSNVISDFLGYLVQAQYFVDSVMSHSTGISYPAINSSTLSALPVTIPLIIEQINIVNYIKEKDLKINTFIEKKKRFIELLKEQRQSIINEAVTKGVNPKAKMKPSGIDWLGDIPKHWEVKRLKFVADIKNGFDCEKKEIGKYPVYGSGGIFGYTDNYIYDKPTVLLGRKGTIGKPIYVNEAFWTVDTAFYSVIDNAKCLTEFYFHICCRLPFEKYSSKTALPSITQTAIKNIHIALPSIEEQKEIVARIKQETEVIDIAISKAEKEIELIKEYKESMIAEAVMGKIGV